MELKDATVVELTHCFHRDVSPVEVLDATIAGIEANNERLNAFVHRSGRATTHSTRAATPAAPPAAAPRPSPPGC